MSGGHFRWRRKVLPIVGLSHIATGSMTDKPKPKKVKDEPGAEERFERGIANALKTPPAPHKAPELKPVRRGKKKDYLAPS